MIKNLKNKTGMTLVEVIIAIAIFAIFTILVNSIFFNVLRSSTKQEALREVKQNGNFAIQTISNEIRQAKFIGTDTSYTCDATTAHILYILKQDDTTPITIAKNPHSDDSSVDAITLGSKELTSPSVTVNATDDLTIECKKFGDTKLVTVFYTLENANNSDERKEEFATMQFLTSVYVRDQYQ